MGTRTVNLSPAQAKKLLTPKQALIMSLCILFGEIHADPQHCVPVLIQALQDPDEWTRISAAHALGMFGADAAAAIPALDKLAAQGLGPTLYMGLQVQSEARSALKRIAHDWITPREAGPDEIFSPTIDPPPR